MIGDWSLFKTLYDAAEKRALANEAVQREQESNQGTAKFIQDYVTGVQDQRSKGPGAMSKVLSASPIDPTANMQGDFSMAPQELIDQGVAAANQANTGDQRLMALQNALKAIGSGQSKVSVAQLSPFISQALQKVDAPEEAARQMAMEKYKADLAYHNAGPGTTVFQAGKPVLTVPEKTDTVDYWKGQLLKKVIQSNPAWADAIGGTPGNTDQPTDQTQPTGVNADPFAKLPHPVRKLLGVDTTPDAEEAKRVGFEAVYPQFKGQVGTPAYAKAFRDYSNKTAEKVQVSVAGGQGRGAAYANERFYQVTDNEDGQSKMVKGYLLNDSPNRYTPLAADVDLAQAKSEARQRGGPMAAQINAANDLYQKNLPELIDLRNKVAAKGLLPDTKFRDLNAINQWLSMKSSDPDMARLQGKTKLMADNLQKTIGGGQGGEWAFKVADTLLDPALAPPAFTARMMGHGEDLSALASSRRGFGNNPVATQQQTGNKLPPSEADINATAIKYKMTPQQVKQKLGIQ